MFRSYKNANYPEKFVIMGVPVLFIIGSLMHFLFQIFNRNFIVGCFCPVNESVWEHSKMLVIPIIFWWSIYYILKSNKHNIFRNKWFLGALVSLITSLISMPLIFYFYTNAFGIEYIWIDIVILLLSILIGQLLGLHIYRHSKGINYKIIVVIFIVIIIAFIIFTFYPPKIPWFKDFSDNKYII